MTVTSATPKPVDVADERPGAFWRAPFEWRTWSETVHLLLNFPMGLVSFVYLVTMFSVGAGLLVTFVGLPLLMFALVSMRWFGVIERLRARAFLDLDVPEPAKPPMRPGFGGWVRSRLGDSVAWRAAAYGLILFPLGIASFVLAIALWSTALAGITALIWVPLANDNPNVEIWYGFLEVSDSVWAMIGATLIGAVVLFLTPWVIRGWALVDRALIRGLLGPVTLSERVRELETSRAGAVDVDAADRRRLERDLHDGAQVQLVSLAMELGRAKERLAAEGHAEAAEMVGAAHGRAKSAITELRNLARGIHPAVLTDRGLDAALSALAARCPVPVHLAVDVPRRPPSRVEAVAYFIVAEALTNIAKHSGATSATVDVSVEADQLLIVVYDDGRGGAEISAGGGLAGLRERAQSVDGSLQVASPPGGPTTLYAALPLTSTT